jgi:uncharacterized protein (TIGR00369 family)
MILGQPANPDYAEKIRTSFARQAIMHLIGAELGRVEPGFVEITLPYREDLTQQNGYLHAGIVSTIADSACGYAALSLMPSDSEVLSVEFKVNLLRPATGVSFVARSGVIKAGRTISVVHADVFAVFDTSEEQLIAIMQGTMICLRSPESRV